ncbi:MAG: DUF86 domain-containing protein [Deltaproteobacteria bacterium]|nr:DUF86 domain-containing protein [Deltaproteobacteria bacterium]
MGESQLDLLERLLLRLDEYAEQITREQIEADLDTWLKVSRALELVAQCCVDLALEIVAKRGLGVPETYRDAFVRLAQARILTVEHSIQLQSWAGLRNVLAHLYASIDLDRLHAAMIEEKTPLRAFAQIVVRELGD